LTKDPPTHFDEMLNEPKGAASYEGENLDRSQILSGDDFHELFCVGMNTASAVMQIKSLSVQKEDEACRNATRAMYETILDIPSLRFMLQPQNKWLERAIAIGVFTVPMAQAVANETAQKKAAQKSKSKTGNKQPQQTNIIEGKSLAEMSKEQSHG